MAALAAASLASLMLLGLAPEIQRALRLNTLEIGAIGSAIYLSAMPAAWASGAATARWGPTALLCMAAGMLVAGLAICAASYGALPFFAGVLVLGLGYGAVNPPTNVLVGAVSADRRAVAVSLKQAGIPLGGVVAGVIAGVASRAGHWRTGLLAAIIMCGCTGLVVGIALRLRQQPAAIARTWAPSLPNRRIVLDITGLLLGGVQTATLAYLTSYAVDDRHLSPASAALAFAVALMASVVGRPLWGLVADRTGDTGRVLMAVCILAALAIAALSLLPTSFVWFTLPVVGAACAGWNGVYLALVIETVPAENVASRTGRAQVFINGGAVCAPLLFGVTVSHGRSWPGAWAIVSLSAVTAAALTWAGIHRGGARLALSVPLTSDQESGES